MNRATKNVALGSALVLVFGLAACGDDDDANAGDGTTIPSSATTAAADPVTETTSESGTDTTPEAPAPASTASTASADTATTVDLGDGGGGASVSVVLTDGDLELDPTSADAGSVEFVARNQGGDLHNLLIVKGDDPAALPVDGDGAVIEDDLPEGDLIGKIAVVDAGTEGSASFDLGSGSYILFCNLVSLPYAHFQDMVTTFTVT